jgi:hypothetical protein
VRNLLRWLLLSSLGWTLSTAVCAALPFNETSLPSRAVFALLSGCILGICQCLALDAGWGRRLEWLLVATIGWTLAVMLGSSFLSTGSEVAYNIRLLDVLLSILTGWVLLSLMILVLRIALFPRGRRQYTEIYEPWWP